jgi:hypothetical protein
MVGLGRCVAAWPELRSNDIRIVLSSAILGGKHPPELTARKLMDDTRLPLDWNESGEISDLREDQNRNLRQQLNSCPTCSLFRVHLSRQQFGCNIGDVRTTKVRL